MFGGLGLARALAKCEAVGLPFAPITRPEDLFDDPQLNQPGATVEVTLADGRATKTPALPIEFYGERFGMRRDIPRAGEHGAEVLAELGLGWTHPK